MNDSLQEQTRRALEWDTLLETLSTEARSTLGQIRCRQLSLDADLASARMRQSETQEMLEVFNRIPNFPALAVPDVSNVLARSAKGGILEAQELRDLSRLLWMARDVKQGLSTLADEVPRLWSHARELEECPWVREAIDHCIDEDGQIRESASPELTTLFQQSQSLRRQVRHRVESLLASGRFDEVLQGRYYAERANRYVLPIKTEKQQHVPGIVHDVSSSGATVFLEPREFVELNNAVRTADLQLEHAIRRLLHELSAMIGAHHVAIAKNVDILVELDVIGAKARLSRAIQGRPVLLNDRQHIVLRQARHPLLALKKDHVVANNLTMDEQTRILVISGPNTGGKTVTLKLLGLFGLMVKAGILLPCEEGSEMAVFQNIYADIGDAQDLERNLSSFSAHLVHVIRILNELQETGQQALALFDELGTSTDPLEGAALAEAVIERLSEIGCKVAVTTHFPSLKTLAWRRAGVCNVSHEFDLHRFVPTYRLVEGLPGQSSALDIAARLGLDAKILRQAQSLVQRSEQTMESVLRGLHLKNRQLDEELRKAREDRREAERVLNETLAMREHIRATEQRERTRIRQRLQAELAQARRTIHAVMEEVKREKTLPRIDSARRQLADLEEEAARWTARSELLSIDQAREGDWVELRLLGLCGQLLESPQGKKSVKIRVGNREISVGCDQIAGRLEVVPSDDRGGQAAAESLREVDGRTSGIQRLRTPDVCTRGLSTLDVRGKSAEEALNETVSALDRAVIDGTTRLRIIHGRGTGKLKSVLRAYFAESPYVAHFRPGERHEGGDGATVLELKP
ncbi:MAG: hypothetical protein D6690_15605 [Nitrospirae bacterium]|nr:MAG: hypothetical protein D6690_15605 [Nitrospirota bacterium]